MRQYDVDPRDQQSTGACTSFATITVVDTLMRQAGHALAPLSTLAFYGDERIANNSYLYDTGVNGAAMIKASTQTGFLFESDWQWDQHNLFTKPPAALEATAYNNHVTSWTYTPTTVSAATLQTTVKEMLSHGQTPVLFFTPQSGFFNERGPLNTLNGLSSHDSEDKHAVQIIGMDDNLDGGSYIIHNSWQPNLWGDNGYGVISYKQFIPQAGYSEIQGLYTINGFVSNGATYDFTWSTNRTIVDTAYATILGRAAEVGGLDWWSGHIGTNPSVLADALISSTEGNLIYGGLTDSGFVDQVYENVLGRHADSGGLVYWENALHTGLTRGQLFQGFIDSVNRPSAESHDLLANKVNMAMYMSVALQLESGHDQQSHDILSQVTQDYQHTEVLKIGLGDMLHAMVV